VAVDRLKVSSLHKFLTFRMIWIVAVMNSITHEFQT